MQDQQEFVPKTSFRNDYSEGAHPRLLEALARAGNEQSSGYGLDRHSLRAAQLIRGRIACDDADVHFLAGGTQANLTAIAAFLRPHEAVIAARTGHIATHETGAIEATGHKVLEIDCPEGKLTPVLLAPCLEEHDNEHMVRPRLVYVSNSTELGTRYVRDELQTLSSFCRERALYLYLDGARLGSALAATGNDLTLPDIARLTDAFYIGGTKNGALLGEALVICNPALKTDFRYLVKQRGGMLAKGMVLGAQFEALFRDDLFLELARHANAQALRLRDCITAAGFSMFSDSDTNQQFVALPDAMVVKLAERFEFETWLRLDSGSTVIRLVTSWATADAAVDDFAQHFDRLSGEYSGPAAAPAASRQNPGKQACCS